MPWPTDRRRWSDASGPRFVRFSDEGSVHVERTIEGDHGHVHSEMTPFGAILGADEEFGIVSSLYARQTALCGQAGKPGYLFGISEFEDSLLCPRCVRSTPEDERSRLFEHDVPEDSSATH